MCCCFYVVGEFGFDCICDFDGFICVGVVVMLGNVDFVAGDGWVEGLYI